MSDAGDFRHALDELEAGAAGGADAQPDAGASADPSTHVTVAAVTARFGPAVLHHAIVAGDEHVVRVARERLIEVLTWLYDDAGQRYDLLQDLTAVDWGGDRPIEVVYQLWSIPHRRNLRVKTALPIDDLEVPTVTGIWATANWLEREVWDMFGVRFRGHPDHRRILMPDNYAEGHPLRKVFPLRGRFSRAEQTRRALAFSVEEHYAPQELAVAEDVARHHADHGGSEERGT
ncbi:MAG: NADH-quinone oxidoreductase subunit C [Gemmatimonadetes bacterium]|nr:NADH-quinone oxidoreductase subunit C [Gemmatimonadota bacterium]